MLLDHTTFSSVAFSAAKDLQAILKRGSEVAGRQCVWGVQTKPSSALCRAATIQNIDNNRIVPSILNKNGYQNTFDDCSLSLAISYTI